MAKVSPAVSGGPYQKFSSSDVQITNVQNAVNDFAVQLEDARRGVIAYPADTISKQQQLREQAIVRYVGPAATLQLPPAMQRGRGRGQVILVMNEGTGVVTLQPGGAAVGTAKQDVLASAVSIPVNQLAIVASDGYSTWFPVFATGALAAGTYGPWINTITVDSHGIPTAIGVATPVTSVKANSGGTPTTGAIEIDGAGTVTASMAGQILTLTGAADGRGSQSYVHAAGTLINHIVAGVSKVSSTGSGTIATANTMVAVPFIAPQRGGTVDRIDFQINTLGAGNGRLGLYSNTSDSTLYPNALLADGGSISTATTGVKSTTISVALAGGSLNWLVYNTDNAVALVLQLNGTDVTSMLGQPAAGGTAYHAAISVAQAFGAMPATFTAGGAYVLSTSFVPWLRLRFS